MEERWRCGAEPAREIGYVCCPVLPETELRGGAAPPLHLDNGTISRMVGDELCSGPIFPFYSLHPFPLKWEYLLYAITCWKNVTGLLIFTATWSEEIALGLKREFMFLKNMGTVNS